jgi:hypothetical protein
MYKNHKRRNLIISSHLRDAFLLLIWIVYSYEFGEDKNFFEIKSLFTISYFHAEFTIAASVYSGNEVIILFSSECSWTEMLSNRFFM